MNDMMLIVDDVEMNREILKAIFNHKYDILEAESGEEALQMIDVCRGNINIVLLDLLMDGMSGFDVLKKRQEIDYFKRIPTVVITSSEEIEDQVRAFDLGANEYISKPFIPEIVVSRVDNVMASNRRIRAFELEAEKMKVKSELDLMTGLCNKTTTEYHMNNILKMSEGQLDVMIMIDIDNFKTVNDTKGHQAGDHVIKIVANLISGLFRKSDIVGRIGGDEFCVLMVNIPNIEIARSKVNELVQLMRYKPNLTIPEYVTLSIGMASNEKKNTNYASLLQKADKAVYEAKENGKAQYREFGVEPITFENDERPIVVLLSDSRNVCSTVNSLIPSYVRLVEVLRAEDLEALEESLKEKAVMMFADVSSYEDIEEADFIWEIISNLEWMDVSNIIAVCGEGNIPQYLSALKCGVADMITAPIDHSAFRRRTVRYLEKVGVKSGENT